MAKPEHESLPVGLCYITAACSSFRPASHF